jgi:hypothetical protein
MTLLIFQPASALFKHHQGSGDVHELKPEYVGSPLLETYLCHLDKI